MPGPSVQYYCPCLSTASVPPPPNLPSSEYSFNELHTLYFCEECDAIRCNRCVAVEVSGYYCPNCLFEVPSASVRAEKNRCARNCFQCPSCRNTLVIVASDPAEAPRSSVSAVGITGEPPYFLYCNFCRWDSTEVGISFEKATGLAAQLQKTEETAPDVVEFERLKEHFEPFLRAAPSGGIAHAHTNPITSAASSALSRDITLPGLNKYSQLLAGRRGGRGEREKGGTTSKDKEELAEFRSRWEAGAGASTAEAEADWIKRIEDLEEVVTVEQRWVGSWTTSMRAEDLKPLRIPLHSKKSKRCPMCRHIIIKPEQKSQSVRYKIKLTSSSFLPAIAVSVPPVPNAPKRAAVGDDDAVHFNAGKTYPFKLAFTNPMYEAITVTLTVQRAPMLRGRPPFAISLPSPPFPVSAYAEAWEYEDEDEDMADEDIDALLAGAGVGSPAQYAPRETKPKKPKTVGVLERKANTTVVGGELVIGKEGKGDAKFNLLVTYTYQAEDAAAQDAEAEGKPRSPKTATARQAELKTFSFYTVVNLGVIVPREKDESHNTRRDSEQMSVS
ncbi:dynactin p62 [Auricularia subglabra TFB-10046 SS5]|nr:dynactin p62 [Auricularia subglabra TFB-10046 SS5]